MLYDGAIRFLNQALAGFSHEDPRQFNQAINNNVLRAQAIINELNVSLNHREGGEFSVTLQRLYNYLDRRLQESNLRKESAGIDEVLQRLAVLREAWSQMLQNGGANLSSAPTQSNDPALAASSL